MEPPSVSNAYGLKGSMPGAGLWRQPADALEAIRERIADKPDDWLAARDDKDFTVLRPLSVKDVSSTELLDTVGEAFAAAPLMRFLCKAVGARY